ICLHGHCRILREGPMMEVDILVHFSPSFMQERIASYISTGWRMDGDVVVTYCGREVEGDLIVMYAQKMVRGNY
ncbi:MAG: hypothetical protein KC587_18850, partial [Nitrospira sp.]|nr:hypothetical protein [Nitrospira sp.]